MEETISFIIPEEDADSTEFSFSETECGHHSKCGGVGICAIFAVIATLLVAKYVIGVPKIVVLYIVLGAALVNMLIDHFFSRRRAPDNEPMFSCSIISQEPDESLENAEHTAAFLAEQYEDVGELLHKAEIAVERLRAREASAVARKELAQMKRILKDHEDAKNTLIEISQTAEALAECRAAIEKAKESRE